MKTNNSHYKHGLSKTRIYQCWKSMRCRVYGKNLDSYKNYGGRGISIHKDWFSFENFYRDMNQTYQQGLTLDRLDNNKGYCKENCRWATRTEQSRNRRNTRKYTYNGEEMFLIDFAKKYKINYGALKARVNKLGMSIDDAIKKGATKSKYYYFEKRSKKYAVFITKNGSNIYGGKFNKEEDAQKKVSELIKSMVL